MPTYPEFLPEGIPSWHRPFWESLRAHDIRIQRCDACGAFRYIPKEICNRCSTTDATWARIAGTGEVYTYTVVRRAPTPSYQEQAPYALVHVDMDEGFRMVGSMKVDDPSMVAIGQKVRLSYWDATPEWTIHQFEPR